MLGMIRQDQYALLTFNHLFFLSLDDGVVHGFGQGVVHSRLDSSQVLLVLLARLLPHPLHYMAIYLGDRFVHI